MSRNIPEFQKGHYYHIYNRGANKNRIFFEDQNYIFLLKRVKKYIRKFSLSMIAYYLMPNHYHFLVRQNRDIRVGKCIQYTFNSYTKAVNKQYDRSGTLFEGPYRALHVYDEAYLLHLCRYIHLNPVEAKLVGNPIDWSYSNYLEWVGKRKGTLCDKKFIKHYFPTPEKYMSFLFEVKPYSGLDKYIFE